MARTAFGMEADIGVVVAGDRGHVARRAEMAQPFRGADELLRQAEIDEVAGDGDLVGLALHDIAGEEVEDLAAMHELAAAMPVHVAEDALRHEVAAARARHRAQVNVGKMREGEHGRTGFGVKRCEESRPLARVMPNRREATWLLSAFAWV